MNMNKSTCYELFPEELPELGSGPSLVDEVRLGARERLQKRSAQAVLRLHEKRPQPTVQKLVYPSPPKYKECAHSGHFVLDREALNRADHIELISTPKQVNCDKRPQWVVRKLPSITNRVKTLARPGPTHVRSTLARYASKLSAKQKQHLESLLEPKPFVTIPESIGYARQQRADDAMWRRHRAKQERNLLKNIRRWEVELLKEIMKKLSTMLRDYYLFEQPSPLEEDAKQIARTLLQCIYQLLNRPVPVTSNDSAQRHDAIDEFYIEFSEKVGHWIWRLMQTTGVTFDAGQISCSILRKSASFVSINSSVFEMQLEIDNREHLEPLSILSLDTSMELDGESVEQSVDEDQNTVIANIPNDAQDPGENPEEEIPQQST
uniref:Uncharacterized protein n=1 Tax=Anopheles farauti TaxID=69004 RepID=A0A182QB31_9DIPT